MGTDSSYLPLPDLIPFLSLHSALHNLTRSHLTPLRAVIRDILRTGPPYPSALAILPSLSHLVGHDDGNLFVDVLVRAAPKWILESLEIGRWRDHIWKEAFERRFLPSWKRYKAPEDTWRAAFLRIVGRLEHRSVGCSHHESWTVGPMHTLDLTPSASSPSVAMGLQRSIEYIRAPLTLTRFSTSSSGLYQI